MLSDFGYVQWQPSEKTRMVLGDVWTVLNEYRNFWPLAIRQIFYLLVSHGYPKNEKFYKKLVRYLGRARRSREIPWDAIRDDTVMVIAPEHYQGQDDFLMQVQTKAREYSRDKQTNQAAYIEVHSEAAGMMPQLHRLVRAFSIPVYSSSGFQSLTYKRQLVERINERYERRTVVLYLGDYDPSGGAMFENLGADVRAFLQDDGHPITPPPVFETVALTEEQVKNHHLPTVPPKASDTRTRSWKGDATCQLEALPPDVLAKYLKQSIWKYFDERKYAEALEQEELDRLLVVKSLPAPVQQ
jgi:hypothetical protein